MFRRKIILIATFCLLNWFYPLITSLSANDYFNEILTGEYLAEDLTLPYDPLFSIDKNSRQIYLTQKIIAQDAISLFYPEHLNFLEFDFFPELINVERCPNVIMGKHYDYLRYMFRLLTVSYLFETLKEFSAIVKNESENTCSFRWEDLFEKCTPKSLEMQKFIKRLEPMYVSSYKKNAITLIRDDASLKWKSTWCKENVSCPLRDQGKMICEKSRQLILNICSENDSIYGISYVPEVARILKTSNVMNVVNKEGYGIGCLDRFVTLFKDIEDKYYWMKEIFPAIFRKYLANRARYLEGELFLPGALREFDEKGLGDFLFKTRPVEEKVKISKTESIEKMISISEPTPLPEPSVAPQSTPIQITPISEIKTSEFENKVKMRQNRSLSKLALDMKAFSKDFLFDDKTIKKYDKTLTEYYSRVALTDMLYYDKLGSKDEPVRMRFLKYMIDTDKHQGLFNLQAIIGENFYVLNDLENKTIPVHIKLENSEKTKYRWQISILEE